MSRKAVEDEEKRINNTLTEWTVEKFLDMRKELLDRQKDLEKSNMEMVEKVENLSNELQSKMDKIVDTLNPEAFSKIVVEKIRLSDEQIEKVSKKLDSLRPEISLKIEKLSKEHQDKFDSIQSKLEKVAETLKPETISGMEQKIRLCDEKIEKLSKELQSKLNQIDETLKTEVSSEIVEKIRLSDEKIEKLSKKFDSIQSKLNQVDKTLKPIVSSEIKKLSMDHQEKFDSIQSKMDKVAETLKLDVRKEFLNKQKDLEKSNLEMVEKIKLSDAKIDNLSKDHRVKLDSIQWKLDKVVETLKPAASSKSVENTNSATSGKFFVLKHTFYNVSSFNDKEIRYSAEEEHFGVPWRIRVDRNDGFLGLFLGNSLLQNTEKEWEIEVEHEMKIVSPNSRKKKEKSKGKSCSVFKSDGIQYSWGNREFIKWNELKKDFVVDDCFCAEIAVKVRKMTGIYKENLRSFDKTMEEYSDVVLIVNNERFYVLKLTLATHSPYFEKLFMEKSNETEKTEIKLSGIDADDFLKYLEALYGKQAIDEFTVEGILMVAVRYATSEVIEKCENFLKNESKKELKTKLQLCNRYNLPALMKKCIEEIK